MLRRRHARVPGCKLRDKVSNLAISLTKYCKLGRMRAHPSTEVSADRRVMENSVLLGPMLPVSLWYGKCSPRLAQKVSGDTAFDGGNVGRRERNGKRQRQRWTLASRIYWNRLGCPGNGRRQFGDRQRDGAAGAND